MLPDKATMSSTHYPVLVCIVDKILKIEIRIRFWVKLRNTPPHACLLSTGTAATVRMLCIFIS